MAKRIAIFALATIVTTGALVAPANAGPFPGPMCAFNTVQENDSDMREMWFAPGASVIDITGDGSTDLDLFVYDASGLQVASSTGLTDSEASSFARKNWRAS